MGIDSRRSFNTWESLSAPIRAGRNCSHYFIIHILAHMYSILISIVIISILIIVFKTLVTINNRDRKDKISDLVNRFDLLGKEYNLNIYKKEIMQHFIIGLDSLHKKLFVFKNVREKYDLII